MLALVLIGPVVGAYGSGKKSKFLAAYPVLFKFLLFWWCVVVFLVMGVYIVDHLMSRRFGSAKVEFIVEHTFKDGCSRKAIWEQLADPTKWSTRHPVLQSADLRMVRCAPKKDGDEKQKEASGAEKEKEEAEAKKPEEAKADGAATAGSDEVFGLPSPSTKLEPVDLRPLAEGLGFILRHKADDGPRSGTFYCTRECVGLAQPKEGPWKLVMRTVEVGTGYPFDPDSEESEVELHDANESGAVTCLISGSARVKSRLFRWWNSLEPNARIGAASLLQSIEEELLAPKKRD